MVHHRKYTYFLPLTFTMRSRSHKIERLWWITQLSLPYNMTNRRLVFVCSNNAILAYMGKWTRLSKQWRLMQVCAYAQIRQSLRCLPTKSMDVYKAQTKFIPLVSLDMSAWAFWSHFHLLMRWVRKSDVLTHIIAISKNLKKASIDSDKHRILAMTIQPECVLICT